MTTITTGPLSAGPATPARGNRLPDFSQVGYQTGIVPLPGTPGGAIPPVMVGHLPSIPGVAPTALDAAYVSDPRYQQQRAELVRALQARLATLPPGERDKVTASLEAIEKAKADLEQALGHDPSNALLQELLVNTYQDEMRVLTDVHEASDPGRGT